MSSSIRSGGWGSGSAYRRLAARRIRFAWSGWLKGVSEGSSLCKTRRTTEGKGWSFRLHLDRALVLDESAFSAAKSARLGRILRLFPG
jgi:hypothetical protein